MKKTESEDQIIFFGDMIAGHDVMRNNNSNNGTCKTNFAIDIILEHGGTCKSNLETLIEKKPQNSTSSHDRGHFLLQFLIEATFL